MSTLGLTTAQHGHDRPVFGCDRCIEVGNRFSVEGELPNGWAYYRVEISKSLSSFFYTKAASREIAVLDANEIDLDRFDFIMDADEDVHVSINPATPEHGDSIWTGGPDGDWETMP